MRWLHADAEVVDADHTRLELRSETMDWLASMIAILSVSFEVEVIGAPDEVRDLLALSTARLARS